MDEKGQIIKDVTLYSGSSYTAKFLSLVQGIIVARLLGPSLYGILRGFWVILNYVHYSHFGLLQAMSREIPYYQGKKDNTKAREITNTVFGTSVLFVGIASFILFLISFFLKSKYSMSVVTGVRIVALLVIFQHIYWFYMRLLEANKKFFLISKTVILFAVLSFVFTIFLAIFYKLYGVLVALLITYILTIGYILKSSNYQVNFRISFSKCFPLIKIGFPIVVVGLTWIMLISIDQIMILRLLGKAKLGYYGIGIMISGLLLYIPDIIARTMYPRLLEKYGDKKDVAYLRKYLATPTLVLAYLVPVIVGIVFMLMPLLITYILPRYSPGLTAAKVLIIGTFFLSLYYVPSIFLISIREQNKVIKSQIICVCIAMGLNYLFIRLGFGITGVALATGITYLIYTTIVLSFAFCHYLKTRWQFLKFFTQTYAPLLYVLFICLGLERLVATYGNTSWNEIYTYTIKITMFLILSLPLIYYINRKTEVLRMIFRLRGENGRR